MFGAETDRAGEFGVPIGLALARARVDQVEADAREAALRGGERFQPFIDAVGATEEVLKEQGRAYKVGKFPFSANGRARSMNETSGFVKFIADADTDELLGCHIIGPGAGDEGGKVIAAGPPAKASSSKTSVTAKYLRRATA